MFSKMKFCFILFYFAFISVHLPAAQLDSSPKKVILILGGGGAGKSFIGNLLARKFAFAEYSGAASKSRSIIKADSSIMDMEILELPPLLDLEKDNLEFAEFALNQKRSFILLFIISPRSGRLDVEDIEIVSTVMQVLPENTPYAVIVNRFQGETVKHLEEFTNLTNAHLVKRKKLWMPSILFIPVVREDRTKAANDLKVFLEGFMKDNAFPIYDKKIDFSEEHKD